MRNFDKIDIRREKEQLWNRLEAYRVLEMYQDAISVCRKLVQLEPDNPDLLLDLGLYCEEAGKVDRAIGYYRFAARRFPEDSRFFTNLGFCYGTYKKRVDMERAYSEKALAINPLNEWALNNIAAVLTREGKWRDGLSYYAKAYDACLANYGSVCGHIIHNLAWALYRCKKYARAWLLYRYLVDEYPDKPHVVCDFGRVNYKMGMYENALEYFGRALAMSPDSRHYARLYKIASKKVNGV